MEYGSKSNLIRLLFFIICSVMIVVSYRLFYYWYEINFHIKSHRSVGLVFVSFYFYLVAFPAIFVISFIPVRWGFVVYILTVVYCFSEWYSHHPLRVALMVVCTTYGYLLLIVLKWKFKVL